MALLFLLGTVYSLYTPWVSSCILRVHSLDAITVSYIQYLPTVFSTLRQKTHNFII